jgi:APA family basic amino acid/polyamine antiporter
MSRTKLTIWTAISIVIGCVIGSGVFVKPGRVLVAAGDPQMALLAWIAGGFLSLAGGLTMAEVAARIPREGGVYAYMEEIYGRLWGFICGWVQAMIYGPGLMSALCLYFGTLFCQVAGLGDDKRIGVALISLFTLSTVSAVSTKGSAIIQNVTTTVKLLPIFLIGIAGLFMGTEPILVGTIELDAPAAGFGVAILSTLWAYDGWAGVANLGGEIENPSKNLPRAIITGLILVMTAYILVNVSLFHVLPKMEIATLNEKAAGRAAEILFGSWGGQLVSFGIVISVLGALNGNILAMTRVAYAMAIQRAFPFFRVFAHTHKSYHTPVNSIILKTFVAAGMAIMLNPDRITDIAIFSMYLFYGAVFLGIFMLRRREAKAGKKFVGYHVPLYPVVPFLAFGGCMFICFSMARVSLGDALTSLAIAALGVPIYFWMQKYNARTAKS